MYLQVSFFTNVWQSSLHNHLWVSVVYVLIQDLKTDNVKGFFILSGTSFHNIGDEMRCSLFLFVRCVPLLRSQFSFSWKIKTSFSISGEVIFRWGTHLYMLLFPSKCVRRSVCPSICRVPYLRNSIAYNHDFCYTCVKWWYLSAFFSFFLNFDFSDCYWGKRAKNGPTWQKILSVALYIPGPMHHMIVIYGIHV